MGATIEKAVFLLGLLVVVVVLYVAITHNRSRWKRTLYWCGGIVLVLAIVGIGAMITPHQRHDDNSQRLTEFWGLRLSATKVDTITLKGEPDHRLEEDALWVYERGNGDYHIGFQERGIRYVLFNFPPETSQPGDDRDVDALVARLGTPSFISVAKGERGRLLNFANVNMVFRVVNDEIASAGIYDPTFGPIRYIDEASESTTIQKRSAQKPSE